MPIVDTAASPPTVSVRLCTRRPSSPSLSAPSLSSPSLSLDVPASKCFAAAVPSVRSPGDALRDCSASRTAVMVATAARTREKSCVRVARVGASGVCGSTPSLPSARVPLSSPAFGSAPPSATRAQQSAGGPAHRLHRLGRGQGRWRPSPGEWRDPPRGRSHLHRRWSGGEWTARGAASQRDSLECWPTSRPRACPRW